MVKSIVLREIWVSHQTVELIVVTEIQPCNIFTVQYVSSSVLCISGIYDGDYKCFDFHFEV